MSWTLLPTYLLRNEKNGVVEIKLPTTAYHAAHSLLSAAFDNPHRADGIEPAYIDRVIGLMSAAQFHQHARDTLCHMASESCEMRNNPQYGDRR